MLYAKIKSGENSCDTTKARFHEDIECSLEQNEGFLPLVNGNEKPDQPDEYINYHLEVSDGYLVKTYSAGEMPPKPITISKSKVESVVDSMGKTQAFMSWLNSSARYIGAWLRGGDEISYDPTDNGSDLASLMVALGIGADEIGGLIEQVTE